MGKSTKNKSLIKGKYNRIFSEGFKKEKVKEIEKGVLSITTLCKLHSVSRTSVYKWIYLYSTVEKGVKTVTQMESEQHKTLYLQQRLAELERVIGQKQMEIDFLNKALEISSEELGYDLKKVRTATLQWFRKHQHVHQMKGLYALNGISKQGHFDALKRALAIESKEPCYVGLIMSIRELHPGMGLRKRYEQFQPEGIGRVFHWGYGKAIG